MLHGISNPHSNDDIVKSSHGSSTPPHQEGTNGIVLIFTMVHIPRENEVLDYLFRRGPTDGTEVPGIAAVLSHLFVLGESVSLFFHV